MTPRTFLPFVLLGALAVACSPDDASSEALESEQTSVSRGASVFEQHVRAMVERDERGQLNQSVGRLTRGESLVYRGTFGARDNRGILSGDHDGVIPSAAAASALLESYPEGLLFTAFAPNEANERSKVDFFQFSPSGASTPDETEVSPVFSVFTGAGTRQLGRCSGCLVNLRSRPSSISFTSLVANGHFFDIDSSPFRITTSAVFSVVPPAALTFDDVATVRYLSGFTREGDTMVQKRSDYFIESQPSGCSLGAYYSIDARIGHDHPADYSVANFKLGQAQRCCYVDVGSACTEVAAPKTVHTGVGNSAGVTVADIDLASPPRSTIHVSYADVAGFFRSNAQIRAVVIVHTRQRSSEDKHTLRIPLSGHLEEGHLVYEADLPFANQAPIIAVELAFSDDAGHQWDSNLSRNYKLDIGRVQHHPPG